jgi:hypothetical protein
LNFEALGHDLTDAATFRQWEDIFDRVQNGEMPPQSEARPDSTELEKALGTLKTALLATNIAVQAARGRVPSRRLTRLEHDYTLRDLLLIDEDLSNSLPAETNSGGFDTVGASQGISPIHIRSYLNVADQALDAAIRLSKRPSQKPVNIDYLNSWYLNMFHDRELSQGGSITKKLEDGVAMFIDTDYLFRTDFNGFPVPEPGIYRITTEAAAYQAKKTVALKLIFASEAGGGAELLGAFDLEPDQSRTVEVTAFLRPGDYVYPSLVNEIGKGTAYARIAAAGGAKNYQGPGIKVKSLQVEGPLTESWPPPSTKKLLTGLDFQNPTLFRWTYSVQLSKRPLEHVEDVVRRFAALAFRRPPTEVEIDSLVELAKPALAAERQFTDVVRLPLRSILSSPQFLFHGGEPGRLDDYALATRLAYFLWRSMPDQELFDLAAEGKLSDSKVLALQVDRMLKDEKSQRFVKDFLGQWLTLHEINATTPDENLYPEYDDVLSKSILEETELFFTELINENLSVTNLIDSDFSFLNRRLAQHYQVPGVSGQTLQKVTLPGESPRGGILTQASVLKSTANGTVTSPVTRGNFVLTNLLGTPPNPPPPNVGSIEPDTRGTTTIRETLDAHRHVESCAICHRQIDPPGFALESFDPIGKYRIHYRATRGDTKFQLFQGGTYKRGPKVDPSGVTADGKSFSGIEDYKQLLMAQKDQVAKHFISQLVVYSTGGEIEFADREQLEAIVARTQAQDYPVKNIIHEVVQSKLFRHK